MMEADDKSKKRSVTTRLTVNSFFAQDSAVDVEDGAGSYSVGVLVSYSTITALYKFLNQSSI